MLNANIKPHYQCLSCRKDFKATRPGPMICPHCGWPYIKWLNYEEMVGGKNDDKKSREDSARHRKGK